MKIVCEIYKSKKQEELYLYVDKTKGFERVPPELLDKINGDKAILTLVLTPERKLARADIGQVMDDIQTKGYYLQLPPVEYVKREM